MAGGCPPAGGPLAGGLDPPPPGGPDPPPPGGPDPPPGFFCLNACCMAEAILCDCDWAVVVSKVVMVAVVSCVVVVIVLSGNLVVVANGLVFKIGLIGACRIC